MPWTAAGGNAAVAARRERGRGTAVEGRPAAVVNVAGTTAADEPRKVGDVAAIEAAGRPWGTPAADGRGGRCCGTRGKRGTLPRTRPRDDRGGRPPLTAAGSFVAGRGAMPPMP